jgi:hypothetical protein
MHDGTLRVEEGVLSNRGRQRAEKLSLLLESRSVAGEAMGEWLRKNGLHSQHLSVWEQEVRDAVSNWEQETCEELKATKKKIREQERELIGKEKAAIGLVNIFV